jgi:hypothetical protein
MWKSIKNIFDVVIKKTNFKSSEINKQEEEEENVSDCDQIQLKEKSMIKRLKKKNIKSRKHI